MQIIKIATDKIRSYLKKKKFIKDAFKSVNSMKPEDKVRFHEEIEWLNSHKNGGTNGQIYYQYAWSEKYSRRIPIGRDADKFFYVDDDYEGVKRRLFFPANRGFKLLVRRNYNFLCIEQDPESPHSYLSESFKMPKDAVLFDIGAADGMFTLRNIDKVKYAYLFECDKEWMDVLNKTFAPYKDKVKIVPKYVGGRVDSDNTTLNAIYDELPEEHKKNIFLKMDIEGEEIEAINNGRNMIDGTENIYLSVCTYHKSTDYEDIKALFPEEKWNIEDTKGYTYVDMNGLTYPYYRKAVIHVSRK